MGKGNDRNYVSIWFWLFAIFVMAIPLVWAFAGENESRKNYFKAILVVFCLFIGLSVCLLSLGMLPPLLEKLHKLAK